MSGAVISYSSYLRLPDLLGCQSPVTDHHDEMLFVTVHQIHELSFKQILHEAAELQRALEAANVGNALRTAGRISRILKTIIGQIDVLETMTAHQFAGFRPELGSSSGFESSQFREIEAVLGRRRFAGLPVDDRLQDAVSRRSVFDSLLHFLAATGFKVPGAVLDRDVCAPREADEEVQEVLRTVYTDKTSPAAEVCEALVDIDEGIQEWRYRHVKMVERMIGAKMGTGGSAGATYLRATLFRPAFPDLWDVRSTF
jgi:tryptophan 2,3-dioxygenase